MTDDEPLELLRGPDFWHSLSVFRRGDLLLRETGPWAPSVHAFLRHLERVGYAASPRVVGDGFDAEGRETLTFIEGGLHDAGQPTIEAAAAVGRMLRDLHDAAASFQPPVGAVWKDWHARSLGAAERIIGHCDAAPWNVVVRDGMPVAFIDWELAGPVDPLVDLAQASWLNANLYDDDVVRRQRLPPLDFRLRQLRALVDAYGLLAARRAELVERIIEFAVSDTAWQADGAGVTPDSVDLEPAWALAWRARAANWLLRHRDLLRDAL